MPEILKTKCRQKQLSPLLLSLSLSSFSLPLLFFYRSNIKLSAQILIHSLIRVEFRSPITEQSIRGERKNKLLEIIKID
ncbi:hypothetical protein Pfo_017696 [Paulownia fortunei]|nr:hypothetical protein Pfo_017696 [Paulownia fortunei]